MLRPCELGTSRGSEANSTLPAPGELREVSASLETMPAGAAVAWAHEKFGERLVLASSFQDCVLIDIVTKAVRTIEVVFLDTGFHFPETLVYVEQVTERYGLNLTVMRPRVHPQQWPCGSVRCCEVRKVEPMARALEGRLAWMSGVRRVDAETRWDVPIVGFDRTRGVVKVNPLAAWTDADVARYVDDHQLPRHPLMTQGYPSIGCAPTTDPVEPGLHPRSGRWRGTEKTECGLHI
ncbi:MAG TPA: phosphoadenylyl-sulfate reductase [Acidimicrobiales bacterium]|nr:phosphoadenylyl-sulfate reductase [Acidimicrobiales bacterium]